MTLAEFLDKTLVAREIAPGFTMQDVRPRLVCKDGGSMSVQAGQYAYSSPRLDNLKGELYTEVEIGFPSAKEELICEYAEDSSDYTGTVYGYVPVELVEKVIAKHGGFAE